MASSGLVLSVLMIILLAFECSTAQRHQGNLGIQSQKDKLLRSDAKFLLGRKMLHKLDGKTVQPPAEIQNSYPEDQRENFQVQAQDVDSSNEKREEPGAFLEAADEVANLMRKDYRGMARRKPPINNHVPKD